MNSVDTRKIGGVPETLLIPLYARAVETRRPDGIIRDEEAVEMVERIDYDFGQFDKAWMSQVGVAIRTEILDQEASAFIGAHPDAVVVNLGAGLCTRFNSVDNGRVTWYELDLPEVIDVKRQFLEDTDRYQFVARSVFDFSWFDEIRISGKPVLLIAEGLLMYFEEHELGVLFDELVTRFPGAEMLFEMLAPLIVGRSKQHDAVSKVGDAEFKWGLKDSRVLETWNEKMEFVEEWNIFDYHRDRWGWIRFVTAIFPPFKTLMGIRIVHLRFR
jgi:O-methyltransferase involved in polyketide biosynthesis